MIEANRENMTDKNDQIMTEVMTVEMADKNDS